MDTLLSERHRVSTFAHKKTERQPEESKIKTVNSVYKIYNKENEHSTTINEKVESLKEIYINKLSSIFALFRFKSNKL